MSLVKTLEEAELAFDINFCAAAELVAMVDEIFDACPEYWGVAELAELVSLDRKLQVQVGRAPSLLRAYLAAHPILPEHRPRSLEACAKALLKARLERYVESEDAPITVCQMVYAIERRFDYPAWLGDLYNACDWSENESSREDFPSVAQEAKRLIRIL